MRIRQIPKIALNKNHLPYKWQEKLIENQEIGGVFLVFLSGKDKAELDTKVDLLNRYCKTMNYCKALKEFATVKPLPAEYLKTIESEGKDTTTPESGQGKKEE